MFLTFLLKIFASLPLYGSLKKKVVQLNYKPGHAPVLLLNLIASI